MKKTLRKRFLCLVSLMLCIGASALAQGQQVTGVVKDSTGPIVGATVMIDGTTTGVSTNIDGEFVINAAPNQTLVVSYLGYSTLEVPVGSRTKIDVVLTEDAEVLDDVVVVGYGTMRRSDVTGAITSVDTDELLVTPAGNVGDMLRGRAAGVTVSANSGRPGSTPDIVIRGSRSLEGGNTPLYVVDGVPVTSAEFGTINANDIESLEILKDAAAQSIYGARASNGVVLVTTKRGQSGKTRVTVDSYVGINSLWRNFDLFDPYEWYDYRAQAMANDLGVDPSTLTSTQVMDNDAMMIQSYENNQPVDWESEMLKNFSITQKYDIGISGGDDKLRMSLNAGYYNQDGIARYDSAYERGNLRLNVDYEPKKWMKIGVNAAYTLTQQTREDGSLNEFITKVPWAIAYDEDGNSTSVITSANASNPINDAENYDRQITSDRYRINPFIEIKPWDFLSYKFNASYNNYFDEDGSYKYSTYYGGGASASMEMDKDLNYLMENIINFQAPIKNKDHRLSATAVASYDRDLDRLLSIESTNIPVDMAEGWNMVDDGEISSYTRSYSESLLISYMLRANYSFKDKYIFTAAFRRDGSSKFGENNKWGNFPSVSGAWRIDQESFMQDFENVDNLKFRLSWGKVGNQSGIGNYESLGTASSYDMEFGSNYALGYLPGTDLTNPDLQWETTTTTNIGLDFGFYKNRISGTVEYFDSSTTDLLVDRSINSVLGYTSMLCNLGETASRGVELTLSGDIIRSKDLNWNVTANFAKSKNEIVKINGELDPDTGLEADDTANNWFIGESIDVYYYYKFDGIYQLDEFDYDAATNKYTLKAGYDLDGDGINETVLDRETGGSPQPGDVKVVDTNNDGYIDTDDRVILNQDPNYILSFSTTLTYKGFDFFADFYYKNGGYLLNNYLYSYNYGGSNQAALNGIKRDYWTIDNPSETCPAPSYSYSINYLQALAYQDASYFRLRSVSLGYSLPQPVLDQLSLTKLRFYVTATNLFTITNVLSYSPELSTGSYPETRSWVFGLNLAF